MLPIPGDISAAFEAVLKQRAISGSRHADYRKWLRYYLDFRSKYPLPNSKSEQVRLFIEKLRKKNQSPEQQKQAAHALSLFFESQLRKKHVSPSQAEATTPTCSPIFSRNWVFDQELSRGRTGHVHRLGSFRSISVTLTHVPS